jgi:hypothetical protein
MLPVCPVTQVRKCIHSTTVLAHAVRLKERSVSYFSVTVLNVFHCDKYLVNYVQDLQRKHAGLHVKCLLLLPGFN